MRVDHPIKSNNNKFLLGWFVLVSALAHLLFIVLANNKAEQAVYVNLSTPLQITVITSRSVTKPLAQATPQKTEPVATTVPQPIKPAVQIKKAAALPKNSHVNNPENRRKKTVVTEASTTAPVAINVKNAPLNHLRQQLKQAIMARFTYPRMARRMGWEGLVGISLHIEDDGSLNQVYVARSSGHKVLDENARKTIQKIGRIQVASNLTIKASDTEIEVLYRLTD